MKVSRLHAMHEKWLADQEMIEQMKVQARLLAIKIVHAELKQRVRSAFHSTSNWTPTGYKIYPVGDRTDEGFTLFVDVLREVMEEMSEPERKLLFRPDTSFTRRDHSLPLYVDYRDEKDLKE